MIKSKQNLMIILLLFILTVSLTSCDYQIYKVEPKQTLQAETKAPSILDQYDTPLIVIDITPDEIILADKNGLLYNEAKPSVTGLTLGYQFLNAHIVKYDDTSYTLDLGSESQYIYDTIVFEGSFEDAPRLAAENILKHYKHTGNQSESISSFIVNDTSVTRTIGKAKYSLILFFDVTPLDGAYLWGETDSENTIKNTNMTATLYGTNDHWVIVDHNKPYESIGILAPPFLYEATDTQKVLFENDTWSFYEEYTKEADSENYTTNIYRINRSSSNITDMKFGGTNINYSLFNQHSNLVYLTSVEKIEKSLPSVFGYFNIDTKKYQVIIDEPTFGGTVIGTTGYVFTSSELIKVDLEKAKTESIAQLPESIDINTESIIVDYIESEELFFHILSEDETSKSFRIHLTTFEITSL